MQRLLKEYRQTKKAVEECTNRLKETCERKKKTISCEEMTAIQKELAILTEMLADLQYAINWMAQGHKPYSNGIERRGAYSVAIAPLLMQKYFGCTDTGYDWDKEVKKDGITSQDKEIIELALGTLKPKERELYLLKVGYAVEIKDAAKMMNITYEDAKKTLQRTQKKINKAVKKDMFLSMYEMERLGCG